MAIVFADRVKVRAYTLGTGTFTLDAVVPGFQSFEAVGNNNECYYGIEDHAGNWEVGVGTYSSIGPTLSRDSVISSSNSNSLVDFPAGGKSVFTTLPSSVAANIISSTTFAFRDIAVSGQNTVVADSTTDTLTLVAGPGLTITTDAPLDTITIGSLTNNNTYCPPGVDTVIYTTTSQFKQAIKLFVMVEGTPDGGSGPWETQACDIIAVRGYVDNIIHVTAYGVTYSSATAFATFDGQWNVLSNRMEITCRPTSVTNAVTASVHAFEMNTND